MPKLFEYTQDIEYLKMSLEEIQESLNKRNCNWAMIVHDKDTKRDDQGKEILDGDGVAILRAAHLHVMVECSAAWNYDDLAKWFNDEPNRIQKAKAKGKFAYNAMLCYLIHENAPDKYQYDENDVEANFDYKARMMKIRSQIERSKNRKSKDEEKSELYNRIINGEINRLNLYDYVSYDDAIKWRSEIKEAFRIYEELASIMEVNREMRVMYITGESRVGKTLIAKMTAKAMGYSIYSAGSGNDPMERYKGQECIILNDVDGADWDCADLLKFLDPHDVTDVKSRYSNKQTNNVKMIIMTSVEPIEDFYYSLNRRATDPIKQLKARIKTYVKVDEENCYEYKYKSSIGEYDYENPNVYKNPTKEWVKKYHKEEDENETLIGVAVKYMNNEL